MGFSLNESYAFGKSLTVGQYEFAPITRNVELKSRRFPLRLRWMTPAAVRVRHPDGGIENLDIPDPTRWVQIGLLLGAAFASFFFLRKHVRKTL
jgi:hypothetical protein